MTCPSPLRAYYEDAGAMMMGFGEGVRIVGEVELCEVEYAAVRKSVGLLDCPHRAALKLTGADRLDFLHRLLTGDCLALRPGDARRMFLLSGKGRILADLIVVHGERATLLDTDAHQAAALADELDKLLFGEDVTIENLAGSHHRISLHGPRAPEVLNWWLADHERLADAWRFRHDQTGEVGLHLWAPTDALRPFADHTPTLADRFALKHIGWLAFNIARIEHGHAVFHIDFGTDCLPHELGPDLLHEAVCFTAGCYRGQEIVARMQSRSHPARTLVGFRVAEGGAGGGEEARSAGGGPLPVAGAPVLDAGGPDAATVGAVTSSTYSPMRSHLPIGFAMVKWGRHEPGTKLYAPAEGAPIPILVQEMKFYTGP